MFSLLPHKNEDEWMDITARNLVHLRKMCDPDATDKLDATAWCPYGIHSGQRADSLPEVWAPYIVLDIDKQKTSIESLLTIPYVEAAWKSFSGKGYHVVCKVKRAPATAAQMKQAFTKLSRDFTERTGLRVDPNANRLPNDIFFLPRKIGKKSFDKKTRLVPFKVGYQGRPPQTGAGSHAPKSGGDVKASLRNSHHDDGADLAAWHELLKAEPKLKTSFACPLPGHKAAKGEASLYSVKDSVQVKMRCWGKHKRKANWTYTQVHRELRGTDPTFHKFSEHHQAHQAIATALQYASILRYAPELEMWYIWDETYGWIPDEHERVRALVASYVRETSMSGKGDTTDKQRRSAMNTSGNHSGVIRQMPNHKETEHLKLRVDEMNTDPTELGVPGGYVDLRTGGLHPHDKSKYITQHCSVAPDRTVETPLFTAFIEEALPDKRLREFMLRWLGYCLTGSTQEQKFAVLLGEGGNGKGVLMELVRRIMGTYAGAINMQVLLESEKGLVNKSPELAGLDGYRLVTAEEASGHRRWDEGIIKQVTGESPIKARLLYKNERQFMPKFKLVVNTNAMPKLRSVGAAMRRRLAVVEFTQEPKKVNPKLVEQIMEREAPGVLHLLIQEARKWYSDGLPSVPSLDDAVDEYLQSQDLFRRWVDARLDTTSKASLTRSAAWDDFQEWLPPREQESVALRTFSIRLGKMSTSPSTRHHDDRTFYGMALKSSKLEAMKGKKK